MVGAAECDGMSDGAEDTVGAMVGGDVRIVSFETDGAAVVVTLGSVATPTIGTELGGISTSPADKLLATVGTIVVVVFISSCA
jgi:hypothetical protein